MSSPFGDLEERLAMAIADLEASERAAAQAQERILQVSVSATSRDGAVKVTVSGTGEVTGVSFLANRYRQMAAPQLAASLMEAMGQARAKASRDVAEVVKPLTQTVNQLQNDMNVAAPDTPSIPGSEADWGALIGRFLGPAAPPEPERGGTNGGRRKGRGKALYDEVEGETDGDTHG
ncbi:YbaB/EbfC family nucleoid-associated protein [Streptomyces sp. NPDC048297]|uniref:YbaB/EbfC family nucleoid-associated protein n=1 Tax=Streptomyces sp. NPDC048297 TaxID=3365531 RepID=UPI00371DEDA8